MGKDQEQTPDIRHTIIASEGDINKMKYIAWNDRKALKKAMSEALEDYISKWEKKNGAITPALIRKMEESK
mgnify:CR=1 FL=1